MKWYEPLVDIGSTLLGDWVSDIFGLGPTQPEIKKGKVPTAPMVSAPLQVPQMQRSQMTPPPMPGSGSKSAGYPSQLSGMGQRVMQKYLGGM